MRPVCGDNCDQGQGCLSAGFEGARFPGPPVGLHSVPTEEGRPSPRHQREERGLVADHGAEAEDAFGDSR